MAGATAVATRYVARRQFVVGGDTIEAGQEVDFADYDMPFGRINLLVQQRVVQPAGMTKNVKPHRVEG